MVACKYGDELSRFIKFEEFPGYIKTIIYTRKPLTLDVIYFFFFFVTINV